MDEIHKAVSSRVVKNWEDFTQEACVHTEKFVRFIKDWLASIQQLPAPQSDETLEKRRQHGEEMASLAERLFEGRE